MSSLNGVLTGLFSKFSKRGEERRQFAKFATSILYTLAHADGDASNDELQLIKEFAEAAGLSEEETADELRIKEIVSTWSLPESPEERLELLCLLDSVALADGVIDGREAVWLIDVATVVGMSPSDIAARTWDSEGALPGVDLEALETALDNDDAGALREYVTTPWSANLRLSCGRSVLNAAI